MAQGMHVPGMPSTRRPSLAAFHEQRTFTRLNAPPPRRIADNEHRFVVHAHHAAHLQWDFCLEMGGVLASWAMPKGPSLDPADKRVAVAIEDHPLASGSQDPVLRGQYGTGKVHLWDHGTYHLLADAEPLAARIAGHLQLWLHGRILRGGFNLVRMRSPLDAAQWLLIKSIDNEAKPRWKMAPLEARRKSN